MAQPPAAGHDDRLPEQPVQRLFAPFARFLHIEAAGGAVLVVATLLALALANSPLADAYLSIWKTQISFAVGSFEMSHSLKHWISDGLMAAFFFVIGLEVKRELVLGELRELRKASLPLAAALGGMIVPAGLYLLLQLDQPGARGWGIPMATDIAFVVGCMAVLGSRVPNGLRVLLLSLAIADDIGAILVIAIGYTESIHWGWLALGVGAIVLTRVLAQLGARPVSLYVVVGGVVWLGFHQSGVHATIAGVILGLMTPARSWVGVPRLRAVVERTDGFLHGEAWTSDSDRRRELRKVELAARESLSPLERLEDALHPWQSFMIVPIFALANAGVVMQLDALANPVAVAVMAGLIIGKPLGILLFSFAAVQLRLAALPEGLGWGALFGGGCLAGIGFTMSLFIAALALQGAALDAARVGVLVGSALSAVAGMTILLAVLPKPTSPLDGD
jgi:NhaA family Na+:H+ antiporter